MEKELLEEILIYSGQDKSEVPKNVRHVKCDASVTEIPDRLFEDCPCLVTVELNEGLTVIGSNAFGRCKSLTTPLNLPSTLNTIRSHAFYDCTSLRNMKFPSTLKVIGSYSFARCKDLVSVGFQDGVKVIERYAFYDCPDLKNIKLPSTLEVIQEAAFYYCEKLDTADLPNGLKVVEKDSFYNCKSLIQVSIPSSVKRVERNAFYGCNGLVSLELCNGLEFIGAHAFRGCVSLKRVTIPSSLKRIEKYVFYNCRDLESLELHNRLESIGESAFYKCASLIRVTIPTTVQIIESRAFTHCKNLVSIELPIGLKRIGNGVFSECHLLRNVFIPSAVNDHGIFIEETFSGLGRHTRPSPPRLLAREFPNEVALINASKARFDRLPIHELCYYQAHYPTAALLEKLQQVVIPNDGRLEGRDMFGMTPFHILGLSAKPNVNLVQALLKYYSVNFVWSEDTWGKRAIDYLIENRAPGSDRITQEVLVNRLKLLGLQRWKDSIRRKIESFPAEALDRKEQLASIQSIFLHYERLEALSLLEMCLWSKKIDEVNSIERCSHHEEQKKKKKVRLSSNNLDRQNCRINCGAEVVICNVLPYLGDVIDASSLGGRSDSEEEVESDFVRILGLI